MKNGCDIRTQTSMARIGGDPSLARLRAHPEPYNPQWAQDVGRAVARECPAGVSSTPVNLYDAGQQRTKVRR